MLFSPKNLNKSSPSKGSPPRRILSIRAASPATKAGGNNNWYTSRTTSAILAGTFLACIVAISFFAASVDSAYTPSPLALCVLTLKSLLFFKSSYVCCTASRVGIP